QDQPAFQQAEQAGAVLGLIFDDFLSAYRTHHRDLLLHLDEEVFELPYFWGNIAQAILAQAEPWDQTERIISGAIDQLNDFIGYRPVAVLENEQLIEPYPHEKFHTIPIYVASVGVSVGPYHDLLSKTLEMLKDLPDQIVSATHFHLDHVQEVTVDLRSYDYNHPVYKRTNYLFGEWDPHQIGLDGFYHRFVLRKIILDALLDWIHQQRYQEKVPYEEALFDAAAALSGTILMASSVSGAAPDSFDSTVSLSTLLPVVPRHRDYFYEHLLSNISGERAARLQKLKQITQQPFGHVRHALNIFLSTHGARQVRNRELALMYARMGFAEESRVQAAIIPAASIRFETEIQWRLRISHQKIESGEFEETEKLLEEIEDLFQRAIQCGSLVDPWNILGFQGQFPLFANREDAVPDVRVEILIEMMEQVLSLCAATLSGAAMASRNDVIRRTCERFQRLANQWDRYATTTVEDIPKLYGMKTYQSALVVSNTLSAWKQSTDAQASLGFWREHVELFESHMAYHNVVHVLLQKGDLNSAFGLLMQWLSQTEETDSIQFDQSFSSALLEWTRVLQKTVSGPSELFQRYRRMLELLEANAGNRWGVPKLVQELEKSSELEDNQDWWDEPALNGMGEDDTGEDGTGDDADWSSEGENQQTGEDTEEDDPEDPFAAAYEGMTFRDSADDGQEGAISEPSDPWADNEFEEWGRAYDPHLKFMHALAEVMQQAILVAAGLTGNREQTENEEQAAGSKTDNTDQDQAAQVLASVKAWSNDLLRFERELGHLLHEIHSREVSSPSGSHDANIEYDIQLQSKLYLMHNIIWTLTRLRFVRRLGEAFCLSQGESSPGAVTDQWLQEFLHAILSNDVAEVKKLLPNCLLKLSRRKLLYVPLEHGGTPRTIADAQELHALLRFLVTALPGLGLHRETWHVMVTAYRMERGARPRGPAITEFDRLFRQALSNTLRYLLESSKGWRSGKLGDEELIDILSEVVDHYGSIWLKHSATMRLSAAESLKNDRIWTGVREFIHKYGADLFHARNLTLGYVRAIVQSGVEEFLEYLEENDDPIKPNLLVEDLQAGLINAEDAAINLEMIYGIVIDKFDRFLEYNSTTTHSDYGEKFDCFLDFLRLEADYDRDDWNFSPLKITHEALIGIGRLQAAKTWEVVFKERSASRADQHLRVLRHLEKKYGVKLPALSDCIEERFVKPLAVNRMVAIIKQTMQENDSEKKREFFDDLRVEIENYQDGTHGTGLEVPEWLRILDQEVRNHEAPDLHMNDPYGKQVITPVTINLREMRRQLKTWEKAILPSKRSDSKGTGDNF
ncbi:MAG: hypothetical protein JKY95_15250, partial [Planctomycetaceae bacterium]|nr:hypothetical protein [Planctomycetaceae bacterium]